MTRRGMWTDAEIVILRETYPQGMATAHKALPHRTSSAIGFKAWQLRLTAESEARNVWTPEELRTLRQVYPKGGARAVHAALPHRAITAIYIKASHLGIVKAEKPKLMPVAKPKPVLRVGPCDRGDIEFLRRRMEFVIAGCAGELKRTPSSVREAIIALAKRDFQPDAIAKLSIGLYDAETSL